MPWTVGRLASFLLRLAGLKLALKTAFWWPSVLCSFGMAKPGRCELQTVGFRECRPGSMYEVGPIRALPGEISLQSSMLSCCLAFQINVSLQNDGTLKSKYSGLLLYRVHTWAQPTCVHIADAICLKTFDMHRIHIGHAGWIHLFRRRWMCSTRTITLWSSLPPLLVLRFRTQNLVMLVARAEHQIDGRHMRRSCASWAWDILLGGIFHCDILAMCIRMYNGRSGSWLDRAGSKFPSTTWRSTTGGLVILEGIEEGQGYTFRRPLIGGPIASRAHLVGIFHEKIVGNPYWGAVAGGVRIPTYILS